jgi:hypothetical protein
MRPGAWLVNIARGALLDADAAIAHTAALTSDYFAAASRRLGDAIAAYLDHQPPAGLLR